MNTKRKFSELSRRERIGIACGAAVQLVLLGTALRDLSRRAPDEIRGPKGLWAAASFVNFIGPLAYFAFGRRKPAN